MHALSQLAWALPPRNLGAVGTTLLTSSYASSFLADNRAIMMCLRRRCGCVFNVCENGTHWSDIAEAYWQSRCPAWPLQERLKNAKQAAEAQEMKRKHIQVKPHLQSAQQTGCRQKVLRGAAAKAARDSCCTEAHGHMVPNLAFPQSTLPLPFFSSSLSIPFLSFRSGLH